ncbi:23S rRNA (guanosine(2251)-2'-O)-methyltransferase RlmB [Candidatus Purcelliella pentastirinorum]|uniref:23S rRNA (Guanosine(2251)-2'-O)-methyltransferase RlmB n=1 Tax=Candidatus Purcelliella pentastirinorum TaxID=472834 RepID=A0AAX3NAQ8_9ENTR|nr:23S rRNA (guanosine(2251)-2'-O)-methyltransferase RlmB [Candidatus Purcelliella pentastirinorum]WDI78598.1 23S rRNA (guanosine(2251)-2'-O)-methyltransferase RlmB [Candidatus Purcelliella pentastirinorum]WDR80374.1 23S rRNA (guanosine(2251)-2'-O)-methyltransferase RlmB [Candidatus Purcelliella pentastirinorum]
MSEILYGIHTVNNYLKHHPDKIKIAFTIRNSNSFALKKLVKEIRKFDISIQFVDINWISKKLNNNSLLHQGILIYIKNDIKYEENDLYFLLSKRKFRSLLILDGLTDVRNLGSCIRTANAANVNIVIVPKHRSAKLNLVAKRIASGGVEGIIFIRVDNLFETINCIKSFGFKIFGITSDATDIIYNADMNEPLALIFGSEDRGIRFVIRNQCDNLYSIPMFGNISSLNVSVSVGICLYEFLRQRSFK